MNPRVLEIAPSLIREISGKKKSTSIDLGLGEPSLLPKSEHFQEAMRSIEQCGIKYTPNAGDSALRQAIARHYEYPAMDREQNVCITVGSQEAMYVAIKTLLDPTRDELLIVEPCFPSYQKMAALEGVAVRRVAMREEEDFRFRWRAHRGGDRRTQRGPSYSVRPAIPPPASSQLRRRNASSLPSSGARANESG